MQDFKQMLAEGTDRPHGQPHFWTSIVHGSREDLLNHLATIQDMYHTAAGGRAASPLPPMSIKADGSMNGGFGPDGSYRYKGGRPVNNETELASRSFGDRSQNIIKSLLAAQSGQPLALNGATIHGDILRAGEPFIRSSLRTIKPNSIEYRVDQAEDRPHIVAVHGITTKEGDHLPPTPENMQQYVNTSHPSIAAISMHIDPNKFPSSPTKFLVSQALRRVADATHAVQSIDQTDLDNVHTHMNQYRMGKNQGPYLRAWLHSQVYSSKTPDISNYLKFIEQHPRAVKGNRGDAILHATQHADSIVKFASMLQKVTPATTFAGEAAHYLNPSQSVVPTDKGHEGIVYNLQGKSWKIVPPQFSRKVIAQ